MKVAIIGNPERTTAWEKHLRKLAAIKEVILMPELPKPGEVSTIILLNDSPENLSLLLTSVKNGFHSYLVSNLPTDIDQLEKIYRASEEANVRVQFSHWPSFTASSQWIRQQIEQPDLIQIKKDIQLVQNNPNEQNFQNQWIDELGFVLKWIDSITHNIETKPLLIESGIVGINITIRFKNSSIASIQYYTLAEESYHHRILSNYQSVIDYNVINQKVNVHTAGLHNRIMTKGYTFDPAETAGRSVIQFIKSIQMSQQPIFSPYDALKTAKTFSRIQKLLK